MKATAVAHPIQGIVKYHGMRDDQRRLPYHDSISVCTAPSHTRTTVEFSMDHEDDTYVIDGEEVEGDTDRLDRVVDAVRERSDAPHAVYAVRMESENSFPTNVGLGSSSSGFAAMAAALADAAELEISLGELSAIARQGSASAARSVTGGFSHLRTGLNDEDCRSERIDTGLDEEQIRTVVGLVPAYKDTDDAHEEAVDSHMFQARMAHIHGQIAECRDALRAGDFDRTFELAEHDSLSLAATTMTGPDGWVYWQPETLQIFQTVRRLRSEEDVPVYFSTDTGASVYVNTTAEHVDTVEEAIADCGVQTAVWEVGGPARILDDEEQALF